MSNIFNFPWLKSRSSLGGRTEPAVRCGSFSNINEPPILLEVDEGEEFNKRRSAVSPPQNFQHKTQVVVDEEGIPLNIPDEYMEKIIKEVLVVVQAGETEKINKDKVVIAALQRVEDLMSLGEAALKGMSNDTMAQMVYMHMVYSRKRYTALEPNPSIKHRESMQNSPHDVKRFVEPVVTITAAEIAAITNPDQKIQAFQNAISELVSSDAESHTGRLKVIQQLGKGGSGTVHMCYDEFAAEYVAVKTMKLRAQPKLELLLDELRLVRGMQHENIINFKKAFLQEHYRSPTDGVQVLCVMMDYLDGNSLYILLCNKDEYYLAEPEIAYVSHCTLSALHYLHCNGMIHRDIKSDNILVGKDGRCKLTDFGFCTQIEPLQMRKTQIGTPAWMPPEMLTKTGYDHRVDTWSFGVTLIECIDLDPPFIDRRPMEVLAAIINLQDLPPIKNWSTISATLQDFLTRHLILDPLMRPSAGDLLTHNFLQLACNKEKFGAMVSAYSREDMD